LPAKTREITGTKKPTECGLPDNMLLNKASPADLSCSSEAML